MFFKKDESLLGRRERRQLRVGTLGIFSAARSSEFAVAPKPPVWPLTFAVTLGSKVSIRESGSHSVSLTCVPALDSSKFHPLCCLQIPGSGRTSSSLHLGHLRLATWAHPSLLSPIRIPSGEGSLTRPFPGGELVPGFDGDNQDPRSPVTPEKRLGR